MNLALLEKVADVEFKEYQKRVAEKLKIQVA